VASGPVSRAWGSGFISRCRLPKRMVAHWRPLQT